MILALLLSSSTQDPAQGSSIPVSQAWQGSITPKPAQASQDSFASVSHPFLQPKTPRTFLEEEGKKPQEHLAQCYRNGLHYDPLKKRINFECSSVNFISLPSVSPWFASPEMGRESGTQTLFFFSAAASELVCPSSGLSAVCDPHSDQTRTAPR